jgi:hypothetical protein
VAVAVAVAVVAVAAEVGVVDQQDIPEVSDLHTQR